MTSAVLPSPGSEVATLHNSLHPKQSFTVLYSKNKIDIVYMHARTWNLFRTFSYLIFMIKILSSLLFWLCFWFQVDSWKSNNNVCVYSHYWDNQNIKFKNRCFPEYIVFSLFLKIKISTIWQKSWHTSASQHVHAQDSTADYGWHFYKSSISTIPSQGIIYYSVCFK